MVIIKKKRLINVCILNWISEKKLWNIYLKIRLTVSTTEYKSTRNKIQTI